MVGRVRRLETHQLHDLDQHLQQRMRLRDGRQLGCRWHGTTQVQADGQRARNSGLAVIQHQHRNLAQRVDGLQFRRVLPWVHHLQRQIVATQQQRAGQADAPIGRGGADIELHGGLRSGCGSTDGTSQDHPIASNMGFDCSRQFMRYVRLRGQRGWGCCFVRVSGK